MCDAYSSPPEQYNGLFDSDVQAHRWPADVFAEHLAEAGFTEVHRLRLQFTERPDRRYAAIAARAS